MRNRELREDCPGSATLVSADKTLGLRAQTGVCGDDINAFLEEEAGEFDFYA
jgi:hypothetical protein